MQIKELMSTNPIAVGPETPLRDIAIILTENGFSGLPVIGERLEVLGVVSEADILVKERGPANRRAGVLGWLLAEEGPDAAKLAARTAGEAMTSPAITIGPDAHVSYAARLMTKNMIKRLPVVDAHGTLIGIVTQADLVRAFARPDHEIEREIREDVIRRILWIEAPNVLVRVEQGEALRAARSAHRRRAPRAVRGPRPGSRFGALDAQVALGRSERGARACAGSRPPVSANP